MKSNPAHEDEFVACHLCGQSSHFTVGWLDPTARDAAAATADTRPACSYKCAIALRKLPPARLDDETCERLAQRFVIALKRDLGVKKMAKVRRLNRTPEYSGNVCASHDFVDANMTMDEAWHAVGLTAAGFDSGATDEAAAFWGRAWDRAKQIIDEGGRS